ncbi:MAG: ABC-2 transporter permease [Terrisporobacter sp.]
MNNIIKLVKLSYNNLLAIKKFPIFIVSIFCLSSIFNPTFSVMLIGMITFVTAYQTMAYEDTYGIDYFIAYAPVTRKEYVASRYLFGILMTIVACIVFSLVYFISFKFNLMEYRIIDYKTNLSLGIVISVVLISISIPVLLYLGIKKARMAMTVIFMIVVMIPSMGVMSAEESETIRKIIDTIGNMNSNLVLLIFVAVILSISYVVSNTLYLKKEIKE